MHLNTFATIYSTACHIRPNKFISYYMHEKEKIR
jgi:hypothetical protein